MLDPYRMVAVSLCSFVILLIGIFIYAFLYPKKQPRFSILIVLFSILPCISIFRTGVYQSGDFSINLEKTIDMYHSLSFGIFPVHWASILNATYGYPLFIFTYPLPYYFISLLHFMGFSFILSEKIFLAVAFVISGIAMYFLLVNFAKPLSSFVGAILYLFAPYHLIDLHFRTDIGEVLAFTILPFVLLFTVKFIKRPTLLLFSLISLFYCLLILSHQAVALAASIFIFLIPLFARGVKFRLYPALFVGLLLSMFYWVPAIFELKFTNQILYSKIISFENPSLYLSSPWRFGFLYQGPYGQLSFPIGFIQMILVFFTVYLLISRKVMKKFKKPLFAMLISLFCLIFMLLPISQNVWHFTPLLKNFQFSYRLMVLVCLLTALIGALTVEHIKNRFVIYIFIFFAVFLTILNWGNRTMIHDITDSYLVSHTPYSTYEGEGLQPASPKWTNPKSPWIKTPPKNHLQVLSGNITLTQLKRTPIYHEYLITALKNTKIQENTLYFPGWDAYLDNKNLETKYANNNGIMDLDIPKGIHLLEVKYEKPIDIKISELVSLITLIVLLLANFYVFISHKFR